MKFHNGGGGAILKRIPTTFDYRDDITTYSIDNLYPQRVEQIMFRSPIAEGAVAARAEFVLGEGFAANGDVVLNERLGLTANDILRKVVADYALFDTPVLHFNFNALGEIVEVTPVEFKNVRYGLPNAWGRHHDVKVSINWEEDPYKTSNQVNEVATFPLFMGAMAPQDAEMLEAYPGEIMYAVPVRDVYPKSSLDSVLDSSQTNGEIQIFELANIQNGLIGTSIFKHQGKFASEKERREFLNDLNEMQGASGSNSVWVIETPNGFDGDLIEQLDANNNDRLFELTNQNSVNRITQRFRQPHTILGIMPASGLFNQEDIKNGFLYYNMVTRTDRDRLTEIFNKMGELWHAGPLDFVGIKEKSFEVKDRLADFDGSEGAEGTGTGDGNGESEGALSETAGSILTEEAVAKNAESQANLRGSVGGVQGILSVQAAVANGTSDYEAAVALLVNIYGFDDETARALLGPKKELENGETTD